VKSAANQIKTNQTVKLKALLTTLAAVAACSTGTLRAGVLQAVTITVTTYTQNSSNDNGTATTAGNPIVKTYNTQAILNLLALDKQAQGEWNSSVFPAGSKLAANDGWFVVDRANNVLADVSDIISVSDGANEILSGKQNDATLLASPSLKKMAIAALAFDDTAIAGGNNVSFYLQGLSTKTTTDTTPTSAGVYTETQTIKVTGAAGEGTWSDGTPFVCSGNVTTTGKQTVGQTNAQSNFAPASLAGYAATVRFSSGPNIAISWGDTTWGQTGTGSDTNADDYCAGSYTYIKTGPNTAHMTSGDTGMLSWLGSTNSVAMDITFTSSTAATFIFTNENGANRATVTLSHVSNIVPATLAGKAIQFTTSNGTGDHTMTYANDNTFTETKSGSVIGSGTYTFTQYSPTVAIIQHNYTNAGNAGTVVYVEANFTSAAGGKAFYSAYQNLAYGANPSDLGLGTFTVR
jgi:hypothetical protein